MTLIELAKEYEEQEKILNNKISTLQSQLKTVKGDELLTVEKKIMMYESMRDECEETVFKLKTYYDKD